MVSNDARRARKTVPVRVSEGSNAARQGSLVTSLQNHVDELIAYHGIIVIEKQGASARADAVRVEGERVKRIIIRPIRGRSTYFTALHELGHHLAPRPPRRLEQEVVAWRWALDNATIEPTRGVWKLIARCLESYIARAERWASMKLPASDHDFWRLLEQARLEL